MGRRKSVLIIGEDPALVDFDAPGMPAGMSAAKVMDGLNGSVARLREAGHAAELLLTRDERSIDAQVAQALSGASYDVFVIGAGLRTLPPMAARFEQLMNALRVQAPGTALAFNSKPDDSDAAALRWL